MRGPTARQLLDIDWQHPVYKRATDDDGNTRATLLSALPRSKALEYIAGDDPRPLLVLRECETCNGTDEALLKGGEENEKTFLLAKWFHCVKLPVAVLEEGHPFHGLFLEDDPEHLFVSASNGEGHAALQSATSRRELWKSMTKVLEAAYEGKPSKVAGKISNLLDDLDAADEEYNQLAARRDEILEEEGPRSRKLNKLERELAEVEAERGALKLEVDELLVLELVEEEATADAE